jgi:predicted outer membrane repeat protein
MARLAFALLFSLCWTATASGDTYVVSPDGAGDYPTIQAAINAAADGDLILLTAGTFVGSGNRDLRYFGKAITIRSQDGDPNLCRIDCQHAYSGVLFSHGEGSAATLEGVTIENGLWEYGGGISCYRSTPTISNCIFSQCEATGNGAGFHCKGAAPTVTDCVFEGNSSHNYGGGMHCDSTSAAILTNCEFVDNTALRGAGLSCTDSSPTLSHCVLSGNSASSRGAGMYCSGSALPSLVQCTFLVNTCSLNGGGLYCASGSGAELDHCDFHNNSAQKGAGICLSAPLSVELSVCSFVGNVSDISGGGLYAYQADATTTLTDCAFESNTGANDGGALHCRQSSPILTGCTFDENTCSSGGGGALFCRESSSPHLASCTFTANSAPVGGGMYCSVSSPVLDDCSFDLNESSYASGAGLYCSGGNPVCTNCTFQAGTSADYGGGLYATRLAVVSLATCDFSGNHAVRGGGIACEDSAHVDLTGCELFTNSATSGGGAIYAATTTDLVVNDCTVSNNAAEWGGGIGCEGASLIAENCLFQGNEATGDRGGALTGAEDLLSITDCMFLDNTAAEGGGGLAAAKNCQLILTGCTFSGNSAGWGGGMSCEEGTAHIQDCSFTLNWANNGGAVYCDSYSQTTIQGGYFQENSAMDCGGGLFARGDWISLIGCVLAEDTAGMCGGGLYCAHTLVGFDECTLYRESAPVGAGIYCELEASLPIDNTIISFGVGGEAMWGDTTCTVDIACSDIYGNTGGDWVGIIAEDYGVNGNISEDPLFCSAETSDFNLMDESPCAPWSPPNEECNLIGARPVGCASDVTGDPAGPERIFLSRGVPNPASGTNWITYGIPALAKPTFVRLGIFDATGRLVRRLISGDQTPGIYTVGWDGNRNDHRKAPGGIYFCRLHVNDEVLTQRLVRVE